MCKRMRTTRSSPRGVALLLVLGMIMTITILALGFIARCDTELAVGQNMAVRMQVDQLAASGLEHARGLLLNPQEVPTDWSGDAALQLDPGTNDFYDISVVADVTNPDDHCTYDVTATAYRERNGRRTSESRLEATLRLDPAVALWTDEAVVVRERWAVHGDVRSAASVTNDGTIRGDVFATGLVGDITGASGSTGDLTLLWPPLTASYSHPDYTTVPIGPGTIVGGTYQPARIRRCNGDLILDGAVVVDGMLLVNGNVTIQGSGARLTAAKNLPAVYVTGNLVLHGATDLQIEGLVVVDGDVFVGHGTDVRIVGGLFAGGRITEATVDSSGYASGAILRNITTWSGGGVLALDGVNQYVQTPDDDARLQLTGDYTLSVRIHPAVFQKPWAGIVAKTDPTGSTNHWVLQFDDSSERWLTVCHGTHKWNAGVELAEVVGGWHHVAVVRQGNTMKSYLDGTERTAGLLYALPRSGNGHLNIGAERTGSSSFVYKGMLDDVRVYNRALNAAEIAAMPMDASLIGHWTFDATGESQIHVAVDPLRASIVDENGSNWSPAADAFFQSVRRPQP